MSEAELITRIRQRAGADSSLVIGIGDDAAVIRPRPGLDLVATTDTLVQGVHFDERFTPADLGHLALASNLSDLAAMGATPRWVLLSLTLPAADNDWLDGFLDGFLALAAAHNVVLAGGNLARGPLNITVQALGEVAPGDAVARTGVRAGDHIAVTGTVGDAAAALALGAAAHHDLQHRLTRPVPRVAAGQALAGYAQAMMDLSDGLLADLKTLVPESLGASIDLASLPASRALVETVPEDEKRWNLQLGGGSDYELLAILPASGRQMPQLDVPLTVIGQVTDTGAISCLRPDGAAWEYDCKGWDHFEQG